MHKMNDEWNTTEAKWIEGELRWVVIHHHIVAMSQSALSWWDKLLYYIKM